MSNLPMTLKFLERWEQRRAHTPLPAGEALPSATEPGAGDAAGSPVAPSLNRSVPPSPPQGRGGFSLIELLIVVAIIGILASLVIAQISNAAADTRRIVSRQQQVVLQSALNSWVIQQVTPGAGGAAALSINAVRDKYEGMHDMADKLAVIRAELDPDTAGHFRLTEDKKGIETNEMKRIGARIVLEAWTSGEGGYPQVSLVE